MANFLRIGLIFLASFLAFDVLQAHADDCQLKQIASLKSASNGPGFVTSGLLEGKPIQLLVASGTDYNVMSDKDAHTRDLMTREILEVAAPRFLGAEARGLTYGSKLGFSNIAFGGFSSILVDDGMIYHPSFDAVLGLQFLSNFDLDIDIKNNRISLFSPDHCEGKVVYWAKRYLEAPLATDRLGRIRFEIELDGKKLTAMLDTGSSSSILDEEVARRLFGITISNPESRAWVAGTLFPVASYPFKRLSIDGLALRDPAIFVGSLPKDGQALVSGGVMLPNDDVNVDFVLGLHEIQFMHFYVAMKERKIYFTPAVDQF